MTTPSPLTVRKSDLGRLVHLGDGGTARVFRCPELQIAGIAEPVYKEYRARTRDAAGPSLLPGLLALTQFRDAPDSKQLPKWDRKLIWPLRVVVHGGQAVGILMRVIPPEYFIQVRGIKGELSTKPAEIEMVLGGDDDAIRFEFPRPSVTTRLALCAKIVDTYALAHQLGVIAGDISGRNLVFHEAGGTPRTVLVDCDSFRVVGKRSAFGDQPHTGSWEPPEALAAAGKLKVARRASSPGSELSALKSQSMTQSKATDVYKIGLLVVRVLDHGRYRSRNRNPDTALQVISQRMGRACADVLRAALDPMPANRPDLITWYRVWHGTAGSAPSSPLPVTATPGPTLGPLPSPTPGTPVAAVARRVSGSWEWVDGRGWQRRVASGTAGATP